MVLQKIRLYSTTMRLKPCLRARGREKLLALRVRSARPEALLALRIQSVEEFVAEESIRREVLLELRVRAMERDMLYALHIPTVRRETRLVLQVSLIER